MHKAVTVLIEAKKLFLAEGNQSIGQFAHAQLMIPSPKMQTDSLLYEEKFYFFLMRVISQMFSLGLYSRIAFKESNFSASIQLVTALCVCWGVCACACVMFTRKPFMQIMQHTRTHKAVVRHVEAGKFSLVEGKRTIASQWHYQFHRIKMLYKY